MIKTDRSSASKLYRILIASKQLRQDLRNRELVCNIVLIGTVLVLLAMSLLLLVSIVFLGKTYLLGRLTVCVSAFLYLGGIFWLSRKKHYFTAAYLLVLFYGILAGSTLWTWGINVPFGILMFGLVIVLAGVLLNSRHALYAAFLAIATVAAAYTSEKMGLHTPDISWQITSSSISDVIGFAIGFSILALVSWLYGREMERSLYRAQQAELALLEEKAMLEVRVKERTMELRKVQLEEMQQMYRFAELGQLSTALLHDLANHLTVLTLELEGMQKKEHSDAIDRAQHIIHYLDDMTETVRRQLRGNVQKQTFDLALKTAETIDLHRYKAKESRVLLEWVPPSQIFTYIGDPTRFSQVVAIIINNAIDAYRNVDSIDPKDRKVTVSLKRSGNTAKIHIVDWGKGIPEQQRKQLFKLFQSGKQSGMGIGLFIAKQTVEAHFAGTITLLPKTNRTEFVISIRGLL